MKCVVGSTGLGEHDGVPGAKRAFRLGDGEFSLVLSGFRRGRMQNLDERRLRHGMFSE